VCVSLQYPITATAASYRGLVPDRDYATRRLRLRDSATATTRLGDCDYATRRLRLRDSATATTTLTMSLA
jgi:hypothetical protein